MMTEIFKQSLWKNFGAAIDMLDAAIKSCPDELWYGDKKFSYLTYHTVIFLDYYLTIPVEGFKPCLPYTLVKEDQIPPEAIDDVLPNRHYSRQEFIHCLAKIRTKCKKQILGSTSKSLKSPWIKTNEIDLHGLCPSLVVDYTILDILFYNLRHVQHHVAQLNTMLRQKINSVPDWISHSD